LGIDDTPRETLTPNTSLNTNLSLDLFQAKYTSEDNASFKELMNQANESTRSKYEWIYNDDKKLLLLAGESSEAGPRKRGLITTWRHEGKNSLMFGPKGVPKSESELAEDLKGPDKIIKHGNTRLVQKNGDPIVNSLAMERAATQEVWQNMRNATPGLFRNGSIIVSLI